MVTLMSVDDLLYSPIQSEHPPSRPTSPTTGIMWFNVPVTIHMLVPGSMFPPLITSAQPGIHYAFPEKTDVGLLKINIYSILRSHLDQSVPKPPAGPFARITLIPCPSRNYPRQDRDGLLKLGINPIIHLRPDLLAWGQHFITRNGSIQHIVRDDKIHPDFIDLARSPRFVIPFP